MDGHCKEELHIFSGSGDPQDSQSLHSSSVGDAVIASAPINESELVRKIDFRVLPILFIVYVVSFLDRQVPPHWPFLAICAS